MKEQRLEIPTIWWDTLKFPKRFHKKILSKSTLYQYLAERFIDLHSSTTQIFAVTYKDAILKTQDVPDEDTNFYKYEGADACMIRHLISLWKCKMFDTIVIYSSHTDVLLLCLVYHHHWVFQGSRCIVFFKISLGPSSKIYNVNVNAQAIDLNACQSLNTSLVKRWFDWAY